MPARKHFLKGTRIYSAWRNMIDRCERKNSDHFDRYGARGISVCKEWRNSVLQFEKDMGHPKIGESLDRINNNGNYEPGNCRWVSHSKNCRNKSNNLVLEHNGQMKTLAEWVDISGMHRETFTRRIRKGMNVGDALAKPVRKGTLGHTKVYVFYRGKEISLADLARQKGIGYHTLKWRIEKMKMDPERAVEYRNNKE